MLGKQGIIEEHEAEKIVDGLKAILADIEADKVEFSLDNEDIHMNIETLLTQRIGDAGKRLHTARSRNDQVAVDSRLYVKQEIPVIIGQVLDLEKVLVEKAKANLDTVMPGYTHLQRAQPTTFAHYMMAYANMFKPGRDPAGGLPGAAGRVPPGGRRPGHLHLSGGPVPDRPGPGLRKAHRQLHGLGVRPGLRHRASLRACPS